MSFQTDGIKTKGKGYKMSKARVIKFVAVAVKWFDRASSNTYHSVRVTRCRDGAVVACGMQYGYEDCYRQTALAAMTTAKWLPVKYRGKEGNGASKSYMYERENNYPILWEVSDGLKRDCIANGER